MNGYNMNYDQVRRVIEDLFFDFIDHIKEKKEKTNDIYNNVEKEYFDYESESYSSFLYDNNIYDSKEYNKNNILKEENDEKEYNKNRLNEDYNDSDHKDIDHVENIFSEINRRIYPYVIEILDEHEYEGSPIYNYELDREFIAQIVDKILDRSSKEVEEIEEINIEMVRGQWCRFRLLRGLIEANIMCELFSFRRPHYRKYNILR